MVDEDGFELVEKSELETDAEHDSCPSDNRRTEKPLLTPQDACLSSEATPGTADLESYLAVLFTHAAAFSASACQTAALVASLLCKRVSIAWQQICESAFVCSLGQALQPTVQRLQPHLAHMSTSARARVAKATAFSDAAFSRALAKTERVQAQLFSKPLRIEGSSGAKEDPDESLSLAAVYVWLNAVSQLFTYECILFTSFLQEMVSGAFSSGSKRQKVAVS